MKLFKIISHPYTLIICFLLIMISGENFGGFYAMYILMALPFGGVHALLAVAGILLLVINRSLNKNKVAYQACNILGLVFLIASLFYFFAADRQHYNWATFQQLVPVMSLIITAIVSFFFLVGNFSQKAGSKIFDRSPG